MCTSHQPEEGADSAPVQEIDVGHCPLCGADEPPAMHAVLGHKPRTVISAVAEDDGWWVKDQHGSYYEGPFDHEKNAVTRAKLYQREIDNE